MFAGDTSWSVVRPVGFVSQDPQNHPQQPASNPVASANAGIITFRIV